MKSKPLIILGAIGAIGAIVAVAAVFVVALNLVGQQGARPTPGTPAPDFVLGAYDGYEAGFPQDLKLSNLRGKPVVVNFWASWCVECFKEADALETTYRKYKDQGVVFLGIGYLDQDKPALDYLKQYDITYRNGIDVQQRISRGFSHHWSTRNILHRQKRHRARGDHRTSQRGATKRIDREITG